MQPSPEQEREWKEWVAGRPEAVRAVAERFEPWTLYRMKSTGQRVFVMGFFDADSAGKVLLSVGVTGEFNLVAFERKVFGIDPDDLMECDLPAPDEALGSLDVPLPDLVELGAILQRKPS
jgi:hypothetical protein